MKTESKEKKKKNNNNCNNSDSSESNSEIDEDDLFYKYPGNAKNKRERLNSSNLTEEELEFYIYQYPKPTTNKDTHSCASKLKSPSDSMDNTSLNSSYDGNIEEYLFDYRIQKAKWNKECRDSIVKYLDSEANRKVLEEDPNNKNYWDC